MANKIDCPVHGECDQTFVCTHLVGESAGLGFNRDVPSDENPFPDAWCDNCELVREAHGGWDEESEKLVRIVLLCSGCYQRSRIRNTRPTVTLDALAGLRWKCHTCEEWHSGPCLDFGHDAPHYWGEEQKAEVRSAGPEARFSLKRPRTFLNDDYCAINDTDFFVRGLIHIPILGTGETLRWGVWGSLSRDNFELVLKSHRDPNRARLPKMFSWLSSQIPEYPDTLNLKMYVHNQDPGLSPYFQLELTGHPLSEEYHHGITPERVKEIMMRRLRSE